jgi:quercetin dioxygenase-like cupin family protein
MTYPEPRYLGETGDISATYRATDHAPEVVFPNGTKVHYLATGAGTDRLFGLYRWEMGAGGSGPGPHFHRSIDESFYVLGGSIRIFDGSLWIDARPGDFIHVPPGGIHGFKNESGQPASMLIHFAPGTSREAYFEGLRDWAIQGRPSDEEAAAFYLLHDNIWL